MAAAVVPSDVPGQRSNGRPSGHDRVRAALLVAATLTLAAAPWLRASLSPPPGRGFAGAFYFQDDHLQYLSYVEQASRGGCLFVNKFDPSPQLPFLFNLGWCTAGRGAAVAHTSVATAWFAWGLVAAALLVLGVWWMLGRHGRAGAGREWGTLLVVLGGGLGWARLAAGTPWPQIADMSVAFYPWMQVLFGAHATLGIALLVWALALHLEWRRRGGSKWPWLAVATLLGLSRPYDLATFVLVAAAVGAMQWTRGGRTAWADLAWLAPVLFYDFLAFALHPSFAGWSGAQSAAVLPGATALAWALAPPLALAGLALARGGMEPLLRTALGTWVVGAALLYLAFDFGVQFATSLGTALLITAALGLPVRWLPWAAVALSPTALVLTWRLLYPAPEWFPPADYVAVARQLASDCAPGDIVFAPSDPSLFVAALTPCHTVFGHRVLTPRFAQRAAESTTFFAESTTAAWRSRYLRAVGARYVMIPAGRGDWLDGSGFALRRRFGLLELWESVRPASAARST